MSLGFKFDFQKQDIAHYKASDRYSLLIQRIMYKCTEDVAEALAGGKYDNEKPFNLNDYPKAKKQVEILVNEMANKMVAITTIGVRNSWFDAVKKGDKFIDSIIKTSKLPKEVVAKLKPRNIQALKSFQERKIKGLDLSKRIWQTADQYKVQLEYALDVGLSEGKGAPELARDIKKYLNEPDRLFRRVRDKRGNLQLSKAAKAFHPGQGKYRSSVKNAQRVTRTEINSAYRESDYMRWQSMDIILGFEVRRSKKEPVFKCKVCEKLVGRYPKTFKFTGWHPQCMCYAVPIMMSANELENKQLHDLKNALKGDYNRFVPKNPVTEMPQGYKEYISENMQRMEGWSSKPYFIQDNYKGGDLSKGLKYGIEK